MCNCLGVYVHRKRLIIEGSIIELLCCLHRLIVKAKFLMLWAEEPALEKYDDNGCWNGFLFPFSSFLFLSPHTLSNSHHLRRLLFKLSAVQEKKEDCAWPIIFFLLLSFPFLLLNKNVCLR